MRISAIKQQLKNPERASIFIDGKYVLSLSLNELVAEKLKIGQEITEVEQKRLKKLSDDGKLRARALEWLLNRPRSQREFRDYLFRKKADPDLSQQLIREFTSKGFLDEVRFAAWLSDVRKRRGKSNRSIRSELASKGIDRETADGVLNAEDELDRLRAQIDKKAKLPRYAAEPQKLIAYLIRQGFSYDDIKRSLAEN